MLSCWYKCQGFLVAFYFPTVYRQFLNLQQYGWTPTSYRCNGLHTIDFFEYLSRCSKGNLPFPHLAMYLLSNHFMHMGILSWFNELNNSDIGKTQLCFQNKEKEEGKIPTWKVPAASPVAKVLLAALGTQSPSLRPSPVRSAKKVWENKMIHEPRFSMANMKLRLTVIVINTVGTKWTTFRPWLYL